VNEDRILIVIPAYNEAGRVGEVVRDVRLNLPSADVLVVDDGSADATATEAAAAGAITLSLPVNSGYGAALQTGYKYGVRSGYRILGQIDADGQHRAEFLLPMLSALEQGDVDVVVGSRFLDRDGHYQPSLARQVGIGLFARIATRVTGQHVSDPTSGLQLMRIDVARFFCSDVYPADYPDADILILLHRSGYRVREVPVQMAPSPGKSMHSGHRSFYYVYKMTLSILVTMMRPRTRASAPGAGDD
jgi:glycosyltransferase involved in cell wall biosynthesis